MYKNGGELWFDGSSTGLTADNTGFNSDSFTIEFRLKMPVSIAENRSIVMNGANGGATGWGLRLTTADLALFEIYGATGGRQQFSLTGSNTILQDNDWHHVAITSDEPTGTIIGYMDGEITNSGLFTSWGSITSSYDVGIGYYNPGSTWYFTGYIAEVRYSDKVRTLNEIKTSYGAAKGWDLLYENDTVENDNWAMKITNAGSGGYVSGIWNTPVLDPNSAYTFHYTYKTFDANDDGRCYPRLYPSTNYPFTGDRIATDGEWVTRKNYFNSGSDSNYRIYFDVGANGEQAWIRNLEMRKVLSDPPQSDFSEDFSKGGKKKTISADLVPTNPTCEGTYTSGLAPNWTQAGTVTPTEQTGLTGSAQGFTSTVAANNGNVECLATPSALTGGKMYKISFYNKRISGSDTTHDILVVGGLAQTTVSVSDSWKFREVSWWQTADSGTDVDRIKFGMTTTAQTSVFAVDNIQIEEISNGDHAIFSGDLQETGLEHPYSFTYDGTDDYINYGTENYLGYDDFMMGGWIYVEDPDAINVVISKYDDAAERWYLYNQVKDLYFGCELNNNPAITSTNYDSIPTAGWYFLTGSVKRDVNTYLHINGVEVTSYNSQVAVSGLESDIDNLGEIHLGESNSNYLDGKIGDTFLIVFDGNDGRPDHLPIDYENWIRKFYNATEWKYNE
jgi:hypothetical protein